MTGALDGPNVHGSAVAFQVQGIWAALLIIGKSGAGKSELALDLMGLGGMLVADDQTLLARRGDHVELTAPPRLRGLIELRGLGILPVPHIDSARLAVVVDLDATETRRLPELDKIQVCRLPVARLRKVVSSSFAVGLRYYLLSGLWQQDKDKGDDASTG